MRLKKMVWKSGLLVTLAAALLASSSSKLLAADYFSAGVNFMQRHDYKSAVAYFGAAYRADPNNIETAKYLSMCYGALKDSANAKRWSDYYNSAVRARQNNSPPAQTGASASAARANPYAGLLQINSDLARLPEQCRVPFEKEGRLLFINAYLNNRPVRMVFDTGAEMVALGKNTLRDAGLQIPQGRPVGQTMGVGSTGGIPVWQMPMSVKVGTIERLNFPVSVQEVMLTPPLLGQSFFHDFEYTIDYSTPEKDKGMILFTKKGSSYATASKGGASGYSVPFVNDGNNLVVNVEINGRPYPMYFDTGAAGCTFSDKQIKDLNITIPDDYIPEQHTGVGGSTSGKGFPIQRMRLGPIERTNMPVSVIGSSNMRHPLLGQTFYGDWQYTIDNDNHMIRFVRR